MNFYISRFTNMDSVEFDLEVVTPMFLGGANNTEAELRVPSIKGMLRFWWRATCGIESLEGMKKEEAKIFGSTDQKASFSIQVVNSNNINSMLDLKERGQKFKVHGHNVSIIDYLSYGTHNYEKGKGNVYQRYHITPGSSFSLKLKFYNNLLKDEILPEPTPNLGVPEDSGAETDPEETTDIMKSLEELLGASITDGGTTTPTRPAEKANVLGNIGKIFQANQNNIHWWGGYQDAKGRRIFGINVNMNHSKKVLYMENLL